MNRKNIIAGAVILVIVIVGAYFVFQTQLDRNQTKLVQESLDVLEWKEYINEKVGYKFMYPATDRNLSKYQITEEDNSVALVSTDGLTVFQVYAKKVDSLENAKSFFSDVCEYPIELSIVDNPEDNDVIRIVTAAKSMDELFKTNCFGYSATYDSTAGIVYALRNPKTGGGWIIEDHQGNPLDFEVYQSFKLL